MEIIVDQSKIIKASAKFPPAFIERRKISTPEPWKAHQGWNFSQFQHDSRAVFNFGCCALQSLLLLVSTWLNMILMYLTKKWCLWMKNECFIEPAICDSDSNHPSCLVSGRDRCCSVDLPSYMCHPSERRADRWCSRHVGSRPNTWHQISLGGLLVCLEFVFAPLTAIFVWNPCQI